ncbi:galectin-4-like [Spodoptera litura]|uniref:Galectin n=1 Tax=Spodoptera litura TaxID=69820 RepID=A0A9J7IL44_SPOLT|nr:galectin-4-like [Spodoptera litura]
MWSKIPGAYEIPSGIYPGRIIRVKGATPSCAKSFAINLQCGPKLYPGDDIAFHFNPRFTQKCLVRNHYDSDTWGVEEITKSLPIEAGDPFEVLIYCYYNFFKVDINGKFVCEFKHRISYRKITHIVLDGDITVEEMEFGGGNPPHDSNLIIPCVLSIPKGMHPGRRIRVRGATPVGVKRFSINLQCGPKLYPEEDIAFHFNPRFDSKTLVRNHFAGAKWGDAETEGNLPLGSGDSFEVFFHCYEHSYKVSLNGKHLCNFYHRISVEKITHIMVDGDVMVFQIDFDPYEDPCAPLKLG